MDRPDTNGVTIKTEPGADDEEMMYIDIGFPNMKDEYQEYSEPTIKRISVPQMMDNTTKMNTQNQTKRKRSKNWDDCEKVLLRRCIKESLQVVENKKSDTNTLYAKRKAWKSILIKFNTFNDRQRDLRQLQAQWKTMKLVGKASRSRCVKEITAPADMGGAASASPLRDNHSDVLPNEFSGMLKSKMEYAHSPRLKEPPEKQLPYSTPNEETASSSQMSNGPIPELQSTNKKLYPEVGQDMSSSEADDSPPPTSELHPSMMSACTNIPKWPTDNKLKIMLFQETKKLLYKEHEKRLECMENESRTKIRLMEEEQKVKLTLLRENNDEMRRLREMKAID